jgi:F1F0 ATPase subunit 2
MSDVAWIVLSLGIGAALGLFYFGGLWLTLQRLPGSKSPHTFALLSFFSRTVVVVAAVFLLACGSWQRIAACLAGFLAVRTVLVYRLKPRRHAPEKDVRKGP